MKYGIFGGAFDPPHTEHIEMALSACSELGLDRLYVVVTYVPPHKTGATAPFDARVAMARLVFKGNPKVVVTDIERDLSNSYSVTVVEAIQKSAPGAEWYFIMGGDSVEKMLTWYKPERLSSIIKFALIRREGFTTFDASLLELKNTIFLDYVVLDYVGEEVSSSVIQGELELYRNSARLTGEVSFYIQKEGLYNKYADFLDKVKSAMSPNTYAHVCRTALTALSFRSTLKLPFDKVFVAAILHDVAKGRELSPNPSPVQHQFDGKVLAQEEFGIEDAEILDAIATHTTGAPDMSTLQKLIYLSDMLEPARSFPMVDVLRKAVRDDFDKGFVEAVRYTLDYLKSTGKPIHPLTEACLEFYTQQGE